MLIQGNFPISVFTDCKYTCHRRCKEDVDLDCTGGWLYERMMSVDEVTMKTLHLVDQVMSSLLSGQCGEVLVQLYINCPCMSICFL